MKQSLLILLAVLLSQISHAQFTSPASSVYDDLTSVNYGIPNRLGKKAAGNSVGCGADTLDYPRYKGTAFVGINISNGYQLGQYYETPGEVTVSGFDFYGWQSMGNAIKVTVNCQLFLAGADSLPSGTPVREVSLVIDSTFGSGVLTNIMHRAVFPTPYKTDKPFILVVTSIDTNRVAIVSNSYANKDGRGEDLGCGTVGGRWYKFKNLNIGGVRLDCDILLEPHVKYSIYNDFTFKDCYDYNDTMKFTNKSSPFFFSKVYNRYKYYNIDQYCHRWDYYGTGSSIYMIEGIVKYPTPRNYNIRLISTLYSFRGNGVCIDTTDKELAYRPEEVVFTGDKNVCSGNFGSVSAFSNGNIRWLRSPGDTTSFLSGPTYTSSKALEADDILYANSRNKNCTSKTRQHVIVVTETPGNPSVSNDSVCLNSYANLVASTNVGAIKWYVDSTDMVPIFTGDVLQIGPLNRDTSFYAQAQNGNCTNQGRVKVKAFVSNAFAPTSPVLSKDTTICLLNKPFYLYANSDNPTRWYTTAAGGQPLVIGDSFLFKPLQKGVKYMYVDAYNGNCASSRLPIKITINHFPNLSDLKDISGCAGDSLSFDQSGLAGNIDWFNASKNGTKTFTGTVRSFNNISKTETFYLETFQGNCRDSARKAFTVESIPYGQFTSKNLDSIGCDGTVPNLSVKTDYGKIFWYEDPESPAIAQGEKFDVAPITDDITVYLNINNRGCISPTLKHVVKWSFMPDANFDYEATWRNVVFASKLISQGYYVWHFGDGSDTMMGTDVKHYFADDGIYNASLIVTSINGCADTVTKKITINTLSAKDFENHKITIYPNPIQSNSMMYVKNDDHFDGYQILTTTGKLVTKGTLVQNKDGENQIELPTLMSGTYIIQLSGENGLTNHLFRIID